MSTDQEAVRNYWLSLFPAESPSPSTDQVAQWLGAYGLGETLEGIKVAARKHLTLVDKGQPMTLVQFVAYATAVMRNRKTQTLPAPRLLCESCGKPISGEPKPQTEMIQ
jgi:hypothetical protein